MSRDDFHVAILAVLLVVFFIGNAITGDAVTADLLKTITGGLLALVVTKQAAKP